MRNISNEALDADCCMDEWLLSTSLRYNTVVVSFVPALMTCATVVGNIIVLVAILANSRLPTTLLIANLALADLLVGVVIMPLAISNILTESRWLYGMLMCRVWISLDVICCTASIVTLCAISGDRFIGVTRPLQYARLVTTKRVFYACVAIWVVSIMILVATLRWDGDSDSLPAPWSQRCYVGDQLQYVVESAIGSFFIPLGVICLLYYHIFQAASRKQHSMFSCISNMCTQRGVEQRVVLLLPLRVHYGRSAGEQQEKHNRAFRKHQKTAKTLGVVVGAFLFCWTPFFILHCLSALTSSELVPDFVMDFFTWLGYFNSALNPIIYGMTMRSFKESFRDLAVNRCCFFNSTRSPSHRTSIERSVEHAQAARRRQGRSETEMSSSERHVSCERSAVPLELEVCSLAQHRAASAATSTPPAVVTLDEAKANLNPVGRTNAFNLKLYNLLISGEATDL